METTIIIAKVLGIYFIISGIFMATRQRTFALILKDLYEHKASSYIVGLMLVFGGGFLVSRENVGTGPIATFVVLMSWAILLKGILYTFFPDWLNKMSQSFSKKTYSVIGIVVAILGCYLVFFSY